MLFQWQDCVVWCTGTMHYGGHCKGEKQINYHSSDGGSCSDLWSALNVFHWPRLDVREQFRSWPKASFVFWLVAFFFPNIFPNVQWNERRRETMTNAWVTLQMHLYCVWVSGWRLRVWICVGCGCCFVTFYQPCWGYKPTNDGCRGATTPPATRGEPSILTSHIVSAPTDALFLADDHNGGWTQMMEWVWVFCPALSIQQKSQTAHLYIWGQIDTWLCLMIVNML